MIPEPIFKIFGQGVYLYGFFIGLGIVMCILVFYAYTKRKGVPEAIQNFVIWVAVVSIAFGFLIAKLYQAFYDWLENPDGGFNFAGAGITAMGGFIGGAIVFLILYFGVGHFLFKNKEKLHLKQFNNILLVAPICITIAHAFGRIGCLMAGCCHGELLSKTEYVFGGIWMRAEDTFVWGYYVPTQLYEALFLFALFAVLSILYFKRFNILMQIYLVSYGLWRIFIEIFRTDARGAIILGLAPSQWQSIIFIVGGLLMLLIYILKKVPLVLPKDNEKTKDAKE